MTTNYPVWGESSAAIAPQIYNWAQQDYAQQNANIGRMTDVDRQLIANANNFYQFSRANEMEDARRQEDAARQNYNRQLAADEIQRRAQADAQNYEFANKDLAARTALKTEAEKEKAKQATQAGEAQLVADVEAGKYPEATHDQLATMYGIPVARAKMLAEPGRARYEQRALDNLNIEVATIRAKTDPKKFNPELIDGLKVKLPASLRSGVFYNPRTFQFERNNAPFNISQTVPEVSDLDALTNRWSAMAPLIPENGMPNPRFSAPALDPGAYNFSPSGDAGLATQTGTYPFGATGNPPASAPPAPAVPVRTEPPVVAPAPAPVAANNTNYFGMNPDVAAALRKMDAEIAARQPAPTPAIVNPENIPDVRAKSAKPTTQAEYDKLPPGTAYIDEAGRLRTKKLK